MAKNGKNLSDGNWQTVAQSRTIVRGPLAIMGKFFLVRFLHQCWNKHNLMWRSQSDTMWTPATASARLHVIGEFIVIGVEQSGMIWCDNLRWMLNPPTTMLEYLLFICCDQWAKQYSCHQILWVHCDRHWANLIWHSQTDAEPIDNHTRVSFVRIIWRCCVEGARADSGSPGLSYKLYPQSSGTRHRF